MKELFEEIKSIYTYEANSPFPYDDFRQLEDDFEEEFKKSVPNEIINADFSTYMMYVYGLSSGGIIKKLEDPLERFHMKELLKKSFFDWFPKYRFIEPYDLSKYSRLYSKMKVIDKLRYKLIELIEFKESSQ